MMILRRFHIFSVLSLLLITLISFFPTTTFANEDDENAVNKNPVVLPNPLSATREPLTVDEQRAAQLARQDVVAFAQGRFGDLVGTMFGFFGALSIIPIVVGGFQLMISQGGAYADKGKKTLYWGFVGLIIGLFGYLIFGFLLDLLIQG